MRVLIFRKIEQPTVKSWCWLLPTISYVDFYEVKGIYFSWLKWDIIAIEWEENE